MTDKFKTHRRNDSTLDNALKSRGTLLMRFVFEKLAKTGQPLPTKDQQRILARCRQHPRTAAELVQQLPIVKGNVPSILRALPVEDAAFAQVEILGSPSAVSLQHIFQTAQKFDRSREGRRNTALIADHLYKIKKEKRQL